MESRAETNYFKQDPQESFAGFDFDDLALMAVKSFAKRQKDKGVGDHIDNRIKYAADNDYLTTELAIWYSIKRGLIIKEIILDSSGGISLRLNYNPGSYR